MVVVCYCFFVLRCFCCIDKLGLVGFYYGFVVFENMMGLGMICYISVYLFYILCYELVFILVEYCFLLFFILLFI